MIIDRNNLDLTWIDTAFFWGSTPLPTRTLPISHRIILLTCWTTLSRSTAVEGFWKISPGQVHTHTHTPRDPSNKRAYCMCFLPLQALSRRIHVPDGLALRMLNQQWDREERGGHICFVHVWMYIGLFKHICELLYFTETTDGNT